MLRPINTLVGTTLLGAVLFFSLVVINSSSQQVARVYEFAGARTQLAAPIGGIPAMVQSRSADAGSVQNSSVSFSGNTASGNLIVVALRKGGIQTCSVSDSRGNSYSLVTFADQEGDHRDHLWYAKNISAGATTVNFTCPQSGTTRAAIHEFSGVDTTAPFDRVSTGGGTNAIATAANLTTSSSNGLVFGFCSVGGSSTFTAGSGYTLAQTVSSKLATEYKVAAGAGTHAPDFSLSGQDTSVCIAATFKAGTASSPGDTTAPTISYVQSSGVTSSGAAVTWTTNEPATSQVSYGLTTGYGSNSTETSSFVTNHLVNISGLANNTVYNYRPRSRDAAGNLATYGANLTLTTLAGSVTDTTAPTVPSGLSATAVSSTQVNLSWNASSDTNGVTGYRIYRCQGTTCTPASIGTSVGTSYQNIGLTANITYRFAVAAYDAVPNTSAQSSAVNATTPQVQAQVPAAPVTPTPVVPTTPTVPTFQAAAQGGGVPCDETSVRNAINAAPEGGTVSINPGNCTWSGAIDVSKGITIQGAGSTATVITGGGFNISTPEGKSIRVTGLGWTGTTGFYISGTSKSWRVDNNRWENVSGRTQGRVIWISVPCGSSSGLIDNNTFRNMLRPDTIQARSSCVGGNQEWIRNGAAGSLDYNVFIEDNTFDNDNWGAMNDCDGGASMVVRRNTIRNQYIQTHDAIVGGNRGCRSMEVYDNDFIVTDRTCYIPIALRGGRQVVFNNTLTGSAAHLCEENTGGFIALATYRSYQLEQTNFPWNNLCSANSGKICVGSNAAPKACGVDSDCGTQPIQSGSCVKTDGNNTNPSGYLCRDQLGTVGGGTQSLWPALYWNNTQNGVYKAPFIQNDSIGAYTFTGSASNNNTYCHGTTKPTTCNGQPVTYTPYGAHPLAGGVVPTTFTLTVTKGGNASTVGTVTGTGINCGIDCTHTVTAGTPITLTATPGASTFAGWSGGNCSGTGLTCVVTVNSNINVTATFSNVVVGPKFNTGDRVITTSAVNVRQQAGGTPLVPGQPVDALGVIRGGPTTATVSGTSYIFWDVNFDTGNDGWVAEDNMIKSNAPLPVTDVTDPVVSTFTVPTTATSLAISGISVIATDNIAVTGYLISESPTEPSPTATGWTTTAPTTYSFATAGTKTLYIYAKDAAGNIGSRSATITITVVVSTGELIAPDRRIDWSGAGANIVNRTTICQSLGTPGQASTFAQSVTASQINSAIQGCTAGQVVFLNPGTYTLSAGVVINGKNDITLRGAGPDQTKLRFTGYDTCGGLGGSLCLRATNLNYIESPGTVASWTGGYTKGTSVITLSSVSNLRVGSIIMLDQINDSSTDDNEIWVNRTAGVTCQDCASPSRGSGATLRTQVQASTVVAINGNQVTIDPPIIWPNFGEAGRLPEAWWASSAALSGVGIENLAIDTEAAGRDASVFVYNTKDSWIKNVTITHCRDKCVRLYQSVRVTLRDSYLYDKAGSDASQEGSESYGFDAYLSSMFRYENNIAHHITTPWICESGVGGVVAYNYSFDDFYNLTSPDWAQASYYVHGYCGYILNEGNHGFGMIQDVVHSPNHFMTAFRNRWEGWESGKTSQTVPIHIYGPNRFSNIIGNVLGTNAYHSNYQSYPGGPAGTCNRSIFAVGWGGNCGSSSGIANETNTVTYLLRWGNYDTVNDAARFNASEVPSGTAFYPSPVPASNNLPASLYLSDKPSWFGNVPFPPIGPDVNGGQDASVGGHAYTIPAKLCYENSPKSGGVITNYNADNCYGGVVTPTNYTLTVTKAGSASAAGTVTGTGINCGTDCDHTVIAGTPITLTATPGNSTFAGWSGGGCSTGTTCIVTVNSNTNVTATFNTIVVAPKFETGDRVAIDGNGITVRQQAGGTPYSILRNDNELGLILAGPTPAVVSGTTHIFWNVNFDTGQDGWVAEQFLVDSNAPMPDVIPPVVSQITDVITPEDTKRFDLFTIEDNRVSGVNLVVTAVSSNTTLIPNANIALSRTGTSGSTGSVMHIEVTPAPNQNGTTRISVSVSDGINVSTMSYNVTVGAENDAPTISNVTDRTISAGSNTGVISFTVGDIDNLVGALTLSGNSSNTTLVPVTNIIFGGSGTNRTVTVTPVVNQSGSATISLIVSDARVTTTDTFVLTVTPAANQAPVITTQPISQTVAAGSTARFTAAASGIPTPTYQWQRANSGSSTFTNIAGATGAAYTTPVLQVTADNGARYRVVATNSVNSVTSNAATLTVTDNTPPSTPTLSSTVISTTQVNLSWTTSTDAESGVAGYRIYRCQGATCTPAAPALATVTSGTTYQNTGLIAATTYRYSIEAYNGAASSLTSPRSPIITAITQTANRAPVLPVIGPRSINENEPRSFVIPVVTDPDGDPVSYSATGLPRGASFTPATRTFSWTPDYTQAASYQVTFTVSDNRGLSDSETITITVANVNRPPTVTLGNDFSITLPATAALSAAFSDPDLTLPTNITWSRDAGPGTVSFTPSSALTTVASFSAAGTYDIRFTASDGSANATDVVRITVNPVVVTNSAPVLASIGTKNAKENEPLSFTITASDANSGDTLEFRASGVPAGASFTQATRTFSWTPSYIQAGNYPVTFTVSDGRAVDSETISIIVANTDRPSVVSAGIDKSVTLPATISLTGTASDDDTNTLGYAWSRVSGPGTVSFTPSSSVLTTTASFSLAGTYVLSFSAADGAIVTSDEVTITVNPEIIPDQTLTLRKSGTGQGTVATSPAGINCGPTCPSASFAFPYDTRVTFSAAAAPGSTFTGWTGTCTVTTPSCILNLTSDQTATANFIITPTNNDAPVLTPIGAKSVNENSQLSIILAATDSNGDSLTFSAPLVPSGAQYNPLSKTFTWTPRFDQAGLHSARFVVTDAQGASDSEIVSITVTNVNRPPTADADNNQTITLPLNSTTLQGSGSDPDGTPVTFSWRQMEGPSQAVISPTTIARPTVTFNATAGTYIFRLTVTSDGQSTSDDVTVTVRQQVVITGDIDEDGVLDEVDLCDNTPPGQRSKVNNLGCTKPFARAGYTLTDLSNVDLSSIQDFSISNLNGKVIFSGTPTPISLVRNAGTEEINISQGFDIMAGRVMLNSTVLPELNRPATIILSNITVTKPVIYRDGVACTECKIDSYSNGTLIFTVPGFSTYTVGEETTPPPAPENPPATDSGSDTSSGGSSGGNVSGSRSNLPSGSGSSPTLVPLFYRTLYRGLSGTDVKNLQIFLNSRGHTVATSGAGSPGNESVHFGAATENALKKFQCAEAIVCSGTATNGGYGSFGPRTRTRANALLQQLTPPVIAPPVVVPPPTTTIAPPVFTRNLTVGSTGNDVKELQKYLNTSGFAVSASGSGSPGNESTYFGVRTQAALARFQAAKGITPATGFFGPITRARIAGN